MFAATDSLEGCSVLPETQFVPIRLRVDTTPVLSVWGFFPRMGAARESPEFDIKTPLGAPLLIFPRDFLLKSFHKGILPQDNGGLESAFTLLG